MSDGDGLTREEEVAALRARVAELERQLAEQAVRANAAVAAAQERAYWLDRWHVDLNALMASPAGTRVRTTARLVRGPVRWLRLLWRRVRR